MGNTEQTSKFRMVTMAQFFMDPEVIVQWVNENKKPVMLTKHGRFICTITPADDHQVISEVLSHMGETDLLDHSDGSDAISTEELATELGVELPSR